jgi:hypothetical protein
MAEKPGSEGFNLIPIYGGGMAVFGEGMEPLNDTLADETIVVGGFSRVERDQILRDAAEGARKSLRLTPGVLKAFRNMRS